MLSDFGKNKHLFVGRAAFPESFAPDGMRPCPTSARGRKNLNIMALPITEVMSPKAH